MPIARPTLTYGPVEVGIRDGSSPRESFRPDASAVGADFKVLFEERYDAVVWFLGYAQLVWSGSTVTRLERLTPKPHYDSATGTTLPGSYATGVGDLRHHRATGKNETLSGSGEGSRATYWKSILPVTFEHVPFNVAEDGVVPAAEEWRRFVWVKDVSTQIEPLTLPAGARKYVADTGGTGTVFGSVPYGKTIQIPITRYVLAWELLPGELYNIGTTTPTSWQKRVWGWPPLGVKPLLGRVNSHDWLAFGAGTLLLESIKPIVRKHPTIGLSWTFEVTFAHNPVAGWLNAYYHAVNAASTQPSGWYFAASDSSTQPAQFYTPDTLPDDYGLYNTGRIERFFDVTG